MTSLTPDEGPAWDAVRLSGRWANIRRVVEGGQQLKVAEGRLLWLLRDGVPRTLRQIAEELDLEQSTVNRQVHAALDTRVVTRSRDEGSPTYVIEMSEVGRERFRADLARLMGIYEQAMTAIPQDEQERFVQNLDAFVTALGRAGCQ